MKVYYLFIVQCLLGTILFSQSYRFQWGQSFGSSSAEAGNCMRTDSKDDVLTLGYFRSTIDFDSGSEELILKSNGSTDVFLTKMNSSGKLIWAISIGGKQQDQGISMALDKEDNIYITGTFQEAIDFNSVLPGVKITAQAFNDIFLAKLNSDGKLLWVKSFQGSLDDISKSIAIDKDNNILLCAYFQGTFKLDSDSSLVNFSSKGGDDISIMKLDNEGNFIWAKHMGGRLDDDPLGIAVDKNNNVIVCGTFNDTIDIDPGPGRLLFKEKGNIDAFFIKLNQDGEMIWARQQASEELMNAAGIAIDSRNNLIITGTFRSKADFNPGPGEFFMTAPGVSGDSYVLKLDEDANFIWAIQIGASRNENSIGLALDKEDNIYTTGCYQFKVDFDPGPEEFFLYSDTENNNDIYVSSLRPNGNFRWAHGMNGPASDIGFSVAVDNDLGVYSTGIFGKTLNIGFNPDSVKLVSNGFEDIFIHKISQIASGDEFLSGSDDVLLYPNPVTGQFPVLLESESPVHSIEIINQSGIVEYFKNFGLHTLRNINLNENFQLPNGVYFVKVITDNAKIIKKLIVLN
ncbi:MAG: T9SS type A sorting domain-containing protein [Saprospiraceae bacterium]|nr:T9SS type A sorting domain-containing protein [Saprospiraceae bacterium]